MAAVPRFRTAREGVTAKAPAMTVDAADGDVRAADGGSGADTRDARAEETTWATRRGEEGVLIRVFFFCGRSEGVGVAVNVAAATRFGWSAAKVTAVLSPRNGVDSMRARTLPWATS